jgi:hypothetical protein
MSSNKRDTIKNMITSQANATVDELYARRNALLNSHEPIPNLDNENHDDVIDLSVSKSGLKEAPSVLTTSEDQTIKIIPDVNILSTEHIPNTEPIPIMIPVPKSEPMTVDSPKDSVPNKEPVPFSQPDPFTERVAISEPDTSKKQPVPFTIPVPNSSTDYADQNTQATQVENNYCVLTLKALKTQNKSLAALGMLFLLHSLIPKPEGRVKIDRIVVMTGMSKHNILAQLQALEDAGIIATLTRDQNGRLIKFLYSTEYDTHSFFGTGPILNTGTSLGTRSDIAFSSSSF